jgi:hypothetical protein
MRGNDHLLIKTCNLFQRIYVLCKDSLEKLLLVDQAHEVVSYGRLEVARVELLRKSEKGFRSLIEVLNVEDGFWIG